MAVLKVGRDGDGDSEKGPTMLALMPTVSLITSPPAKHTVQPYHDGHSSERMLQGEESIENYELDRLWREKGGEKRVLFIVTVSVLVGLDASAR